MAQQAPEGAYVLVTTPHQQVRRLTSANGLQSFRDVSIVRASLAQKLFVPIQLSETAGELLERVAFIEVRYPRLSRRLSATRGSSLPRSVSWLRARPTRSTSTARRYHLLERGTERLTQPAAERADSA